MNMVTDILYQMQMLNMATLPAQPAAKPEGDRDFQTLLEQKQQGDQEIHGQQKPAQKEPEQAQPEQGAQQEGPVDTAEQLKQLASLQAALVLPQIQLVQPQPSQQGVAEVIAPLLAEEPASPLQTVAAEPQAPAVPVMEQAGPEGAAETMPTASQPAVDQSPMQAAAAPVDNQSQPVQSQTAEQSPAQEQPAAEVMPAQVKSRQAEEGAAAPEPVFEDVKATPIKVGETVHTEEGQNVATQLADQVEAALQKGERRIEIQLTPENLGTITVELTQGADATLHVAIRAANENAANLLDRHTAGLERALLQSSQGPVQVEVQRQQEAQPDQQQLL
ncbi:MAG TPA: flagellar hook-length control protein FliK, partial [Firmicutes bacterium]|nr:flagellar hook-length control protein FliK [Bacillota bacterium]